MAKYKQRQALALSARLSSQISVPEFSASAIAGLEAEAARIVADDAEKRSNGKASLHLVMTEDEISGFIKNKHTIVRFAGGAAAVTTHG
jgi:hypothetical protein